MQDNILSGLGCNPASLGYLDAGLDTALSEAVVSKACGISLPSGSGASYKGIVGSCGGHTNQYHFHERLSCLYDTSADGHSAQVALMNDGKYLYGKWETKGVAPQLDACGGHFGVNPDSPTTSVYHYHVQDAAPFTLGCFGPNADGSLVSVSQCRALYTGTGLNGGGCDGSLKSYETNGGTKTYDNFCPCFDANGSNSGVNIVELPAVLAGTSTSANGTTNSTTGVSSGTSYAPGPAMNEWTKTHWSNGTARAITHELSFVYSGDITSVSSSAIEAVRAAIASALNLVPAAVQIRCVCAGPCSATCKGYEDTTKTAFSSRQSMRALHQVSGPTLHIRYVVFSEDLELSKLESADYIATVYANLKASPSDFPSAALAEKPESAVSPTLETALGDSSSAPLRTADAAACTIAMSLSLLAAA